MKVRQWRINFNNYNSRENIDFLGWQKYEVKWANNDPAHKGLRYEHRLSNLVKTLRTSEMRIHPRSRKLSGRG